MGHALKERRQNLQKEEEDYKENHEKCGQRLLEEYQEWIGPMGQQNATKFFVTEMLAPRMLTSTSDALYCVYFIKQMIKMKTPQFQLLDFYNCLTLCLPQFMRCSTESEAEIFGLFLRDMMQYILDLRQNEAKFNETIKDNPVFYRNYYGSNSKKFEIQYCSFKELKKGHAKWESRIIKAVKPGLRSDDWMEKNTALKVLYKTFRVCPLVDKNAKDVLELVDEISTKEVRKDIKTFAASLAVRLKLQKERWIIDDDKKGKNATTTGDKDDKKDERDDRTKDEKRDKDRKEGDRRKRDRDEKDDEKNKRLREEKRDSRDDKRGSDKKERKDDKKDRKDDRDRKEEDRDKRRPDKREDPLRTGGRKEDDRKRDRDDRDKRSPNRREESGKRRKE